MTTPDGESSEDRPAGSGALLLCFLALVTVAIGAYGALAWSLIPVGFTGQIDRVEYQSDSGSRFRELHLADGRFYVVDRQVAHDLGQEQGAAGISVHKRGWTQDVRASDRTVLIRPSGEFWKVLATLAVIAIAALVRNRSVRTSRLARPEVLESAEPVP